MNQHFAHGTYHFREAGSHLYHGVRHELGPVEGRVRRALGREIDPEPTRRERAMRQVRAVEHGAASVRDRIRG